MLDRRVFLNEDDYAPITFAAGSDEPFRKPDHKAKRHPKPRNTDCRGRFALRSKKPGRVFAEMGGDE